LLGLWISNQVNIKTSLLGYYSKISQWKLLELHLEDLINPISLITRARVLPAQMLVTRTDILQSPYQLPCQMSTAIPGFEFG
jgi:hypothetical protein